MRLVIATVLTALVAGCGGGGKDGPTRLAIKAWPTGRGGPMERWTLTCPKGGTLPEPARACERLLALDDPLAPVASGVACTQIYGGPAVAEVGGTFRGKAVHAAFSRTDGCQIERWNVVAFLFPGVTSPRS